LTITPQRKLLALGLRFLAIVPCLLALPLFLLAGWSMGAWALAAGLLVLNIGLALFFDLVSRNRSQVTIVGFMGMSLLIRAWLTFGILFVIAWQGDRDLAIVAAGAFLVYFTFDMVGRSVAHVVSRSDGPPGAPNGGHA
jgi:hypothetical protein